MSNFGPAPIKQEDHTTNLDTGESHPTTAAEKEAQRRDTSTYMEIQVDPKKESREAIHKRVDAWLDDYNNSRGGW